MTLNSASPTRCSSRLSYRRNEHQADQVSNINRGRSVNHQPAQDSRLPAKW